MTALLQVLYCHGWPILEQLQLEEALLRAGSGNFCLISTGTMPAIVVGAFSSVEEAVDLDLWRRNPIPIIRRFSAGGTVVLDENSLIVTFIFEKSAINVAPYPKDILEWSAQLHSRALGIPLKLQAQDYVIGDRKCGGNAQAIAKTRWLHHTSFLWDYCPKYMQLLRMPKKQPVYRQNRLHNEFICSLNAWFLNKNMWMNALEKHLSAAFDMVVTDPSVLKSVLALPHRRATGIILRR